MRARGIMTARDLSDRTGAPIGTVKGWLDASSMVGSTSKWMRALWLVLGMTSAELMALGALDASASPRRRKER